MTNNLHENKIYVGVFGSSISEAGLKNINEYNYKSGGYTFLDSKMNPFWEFIAYKIPENVSPNLLTILGFLCSLIAILLTMNVSPMLDNIIPLESSIIISVLLFIYQTLDAADGKHARRLNISSPLGQLLDHGLDSYTTIFFSTIFCASCNLGWNYTFFVFISIVQFKMFSFIWLECHCKIFRCSSSDYLGVTESQFIVIFTTIYSSMGSPNILFRPIFQDISTIDIIILIMIAIGIFTLVNDILSGIGELKSRKSVKIACLEICGIMCHLLFQFLFLCSNTYKTFPLTTMFVLTTSSSIIALRMNVSSFTLEELPFVHWPALPFYISSVLLLFGNILFDHFLDVQLIILLIVAIWNTMYTIDFALVTIQSICMHLNISLFATKSVTNSSSDNTICNYGNSVRSTKARMEGSKVQLSTSRSLKKNHRD
ncbi:putative ethanolaminephosphotransferase [Cryptosporidium canis]|uniref:Ethanolaminephosphotransferase n=1 Tax=Cryptosporidium canis TaxID=195482 RepID=A0A9D5DKK4_9CRYT|nr:putative ethanolaminephosphotransferase [Cryptosporidium canis]